MLFTQRVQNWAFCCRVEARLSKTRRIKRALPTNPAELRLPVDDLHIQVFTTLGVYGHAIILLNTRETRATPTYTWSSKRQPQKGHLLARERKKRNVVGTQPAREAT